MRLNAFPPIPHYEIESHNAVCTTMVHDGAVQHG